MQRAASARASFFDASALVLLYLDQPGAPALRAYFAAEPLKYTTPFCFYESLSQLKGVWQGRRSGLKLTKDQYLHACTERAAGYGSVSRSVKDLDFSAPTVFREARTLVERTSLDLSDAFQIISVKQGYFSPLINESRTVFVTADGPLAQVATSEGLRVWLCTSGAAPP